MIDKIIDFITELVILEMVIITILFVFCGMLGGVLYLWKLILN